MRMQQTYDRVGMLLDLSVCIGCRACQVACREWNELPALPTAQRGSYENPLQLSGDTWKQVKFIEREEAGLPAWFFYSDSCKHCANAPCMEACPTGAIFRTQDGMILINEDVCNGNGHCVPACPFQVIGLREKTGVAAKCTFCYERVGDRLEPACAAVCPTDCIQFGERDALVAIARRRAAHLRQRGEATAGVYGADELGGLGVLYVLTREPELYGLPRDPLEPRRRLPGALGATAAVAALLFVIAALLLTGEPPL